MDVDMRDAALRPRRGTPRQRNTPYAREALFIKGTSGATWVVVANLVKGTSMEDVRLTFEPFGRVAEIKRFSMPNLASNAVAFQVAFEQRRDALAACKKYDGVLADGRVLQVTLQRSEAVPVQKAAVQAPKQHPRVKLPKGVPSSQDPTLPIATRRRLSEAETKFLREAEQLYKAQGVDSADQLSVQRRRKLAEGEARYFKATKAIMSGGSAEKLQDRLGSLPLMQRLAATGTGGAAPAAATKSAKKRKQRAKRVPSSMDVE
ncbi:Structural maintenance of chromosomes protein 3 [Malassezia vespertilionis]|uniref:RRM domain-containing protein n=1 Tax=Malassezia vespertilionis TaxID=2020962 RepID=A0A2N1JG07_9BASI|nr:Structural maintenance of chromosomes protein 3 [Malassezia vespertilionis]PKI85466.1 hypothetical protein MVES_000206 [Malassezia vespertilionis]WFD04891.1 Structural maintenance of chromosomes protein 3 [Malassezia vespertilionis]